MQDQINRLESLGICTATLNSDMGIKAKREMYSKIESGSVKMLYIAPETLMNEDTLIYLIKNIKVSFIAIDESHVVSAWRK